MAPALRRDAIKLPNLLELQVSSGLTAHAHDRSEGGGEVEAARAVVAVVLDSESTRERGRSKKP